MVDKPKFRDLHLAFCDTETTGLDPNTHEVIEIAAIIYDHNTNKVIKDWSKKVSPRHIKTATDYALKINGYNDAPETYKGDIESTMKEFYDLTKDCIIVGQNIQFDINFIEKYYNEFNIAKEVHRHRKLELTSLVWPVVKDTDLDNLSLEKLCNHFGISNEGSHRALPDCYRTLEVYKCTMNLYNSRKT